MELTENLHLNWLTFGVNSIQNSYYYFKIPTKNKKLCKFKKFEYISAETDVQHVV